MRKVTLNTGSGLRVGIFWVCAGEAKAERREVGCWPPGRRNGLRLLEQGARSSHCGERAGERRRDHPWAWISRKVAVCFRKMPPG